MKSAFTLCFILSLMSASATVKTTVADGSWFNSANWNPAGVPLAEDTVLINHDITVFGNYVDFGANWLIVNTGASIVSDTIFALHGNLRLLGTMDIHTIAVGDGDSTNIYGTVSGVKFAPGNTTNINYGTILSDTLVTGDVFDNYGLIDINDLIIGGGLFLNHSSAAIVSSVSCVNGSPVVNQLNATMVIGDLTTGENITNNGDISCVNWTHGTGIADGTTGKYCISMCFINSSDITGTVDICDATPGGFCDFDFGTIAGTVTFCTAGGCNNNVSIDEISNSLSIYPNPVSDILFLNDAPIGSCWQLLDINGKLCKTGIVVSNHEEVSLTNLEPGIYFLKNQSSIESSITKIIKK